MRTTIYAMIAIGAIFTLLGCGGDTAAPRVANQPVTQKPAVPAPTEDSPAASTATDAASDEVAAERAKLSVEDRVLVDAQEWCVVNSKGRLGSMGQPVKLILKGQPVFLCCSSCKKKAEADPDKTLAKLDDLKRKKSPKSQKG
jgi:hypothetical protein